MDVGLQVADRGGSGVARTEYRVDGGPWQPYVAAEEKLRPDACAKQGSAATSEAWVAIYCGQEIQIYDGPEGEPQKTGSIYNLDPIGLGEAKPSAKGAWNDYEIRVEGQRYTVVRNGAVINRFDNQVRRPSSRAGTRRPAIASSTAARSACTTTATPTRSRSPTCA